MKGKAMIGIGLSIGLISVLGYVSHKKKELEKLVKQLEFGISDVRNFKLSLKTVAMDIYLNALNPTSTSLYINTGFVKAKILRVYHKKTNKLLAFSNLDTSVIHIPNGQFYFFEPIHIKIPLLTGGELLLNQLTKKRKIQEDFTEQLAFELELTGLGKTHIITF